MKYIIVWLLLSCILVQGIVRADYLEVTRPVTMKAAASGDAEIVTRLQVGDQLALLDMDQENGYYYCRNVGLDRSGYVYRSFVRRYSGTLHVSDRTSGSLSTNDLSPSYFNAPTRSMYVHFVDVGQGLCVVVEFPCGIVMVDAGYGSPKSGSDIIGYIETIYERRGDLPRDTIAAVYVTHNHKDHTAALVQLANRFDILNLIDNGATDKDLGRLRAQAEAGAIRTEITGINDAEIPSTGLHNSQIDPVQCATCDPTITILSGRVLEGSDWWSDDFENENNQSLVVRIDFGESAILFTGDLQDAGINKLLDLYGETDLLDADVYQVGHHGSHNATTQALLQEITPDLAVCSMGSPDFRGSASAWNYGHPNDRVIQMLQEYVSLARMPSVTESVAEKSKKFHTTLVDKGIWATGWDGTVVVECSQDGKVRVATDAQAAGPIL